MKRTSLFLALALAAALAGCGGSKPAAPASSPSTSPAPAPQSKDPVLAAVKAGGKLKVGVDATFAPFEYVKDGNKTGFDIDLAEAVARKLGASGVEWVDLDFKGLIPGLLAKRFDMIASAMYITAERQQTVDFSDPYYPGGLVILVKKSRTDIKEPDDLAGKKVAVQTGTKSVEYLQKNNPKAQLVQVEKNAEMFASLDSNRADAVVTGKPAAKVYAQSHPDTTVLNKQITTEEYGFGFRKENTDLKAAVNQAVKDLKADGTYQKLVDKWFEAKQ